MTRVNLTLCASLILALLLGLSIPSLADTPPILEVFVSIPPQAWLVEQVGGDLVKVSILAGPGQSPATYEPTPRQMAHLARAELYFRIGVPFETAWMDQVRQNNPALNIVDLRRNIPLRRMESHHHHAHSDDTAHSHVHEDGKDPHVWLDPINAQVMAQTIFDSLSEARPDSRNLFQQNLELLQETLTRIDEKISQILQPTQGRKFLVFHPAWGYFAQRYGLEQIPVEIEGKEPGARDLVKLTEIAKKENLNFIVVQKQFSAKTAIMLAHSLGAKLVDLDPLSADYADNLVHIAETLAAHFQ